MSNAFNNPLPGVPNIESPFFGEIFSSMDISDEERAIAVSLHERGYAIIDFPEREFGKIADDIKQSLTDRYDWDDWLKSGHENGDGLRLQDAWKFDESVKRIATNAEILRLLSLLYGRPAWPFQTLNFPVGTQQHFHTDSVHFSSVPERFMCGVWVALEDVSADAGPLIYYPGSHKWPIYTNEHIVRPAMDSETLPTQAVFEPMWSELVRAQHMEQEHFLPKKGQALIWTANLLHGGDRHINKDATRWSQVTHYYFDDCAYYTPMLSDPFFGNIQFRKLSNICTGQVVDNVYAGRRILDEFIDNSQRLDFINNGLKPDLPDDFDPFLYLAANPDVARAGADPVAHYLDYGRREGRALKPA